MSLLRRRMMMAAASAASGGDLIRFSIKSPNPENPILNREAVRNMTWAEWVNSDYNLKYADIYENGLSNQYFEALTNEIYHCDEGWAIVCPQIDFVKPDDIIIENFIYGSDVLDL